jgi:hypothetical protein
MPNNVPKKLPDGPINMPPFQKKKNTGGLKLSSVLKFLHMGLQKKNSSGKNYLQFLKQRSNAVINLGMKHQATAIRYCREQRPQAIQTI